MATITMDVSGGEMGPLRLNNVSTVFSWRVFITFREERMYAEKTAVNAIRITIALFDFLIFAKVIMNYSKYRALYLIC